MNINDGEKKNNKFDFIELSLKTHIGNLVDDFIAQNMGNRISSYLADGFTMRIVRSFKEVEKEIIKKIEESLQLEIVK